MGSDSKLFQERHMQGIEGAKLQLSERKRDREKERKNSQYDCTKNSFSLSF
jgi:hypothetical protein